MVSIKQAWKGDPLYIAGKVELVSTDWVWRYRGTDVSPMADLTDGTLVDLNGLWLNILEEGLQRPLIMRVGVNDRTMRLEAGNHRIQVFKKYGINEVPVTVQLSEYCGPNAKSVMNDGSHSFSAAGELLIGDISEEYMRPSEVFKSLHNRIRTKN